MPSRLRAALPILGLGMLAGLLYASRLQYAPIYLAHDEVLFGLTAHAVAHTGRDLNGQPLPLFSHIVNRYAAYYLTPVLVYTTAPFLLVLPVTEWAIRLPTALVGVLDVVLMYLVAQRFFRRASLAAAAAVLLALTPAHFIQARLASDHIYPVPFVLAWLLGLSAFIDSGRRWQLAVTAGVLSLGVFSYLASLVMMPLYFGLTCAVLFALGKSGKAYAIAALGFACPLLILSAWLIAVPSRAAELLHLYPLYDTSAAGPLQGVLRLLSYSSLGAHAAVYWTFFNPSLLFFSGDSSLMNSTRQAGVFLIPLAVLIPGGMYHILVNRRTPLTLLVLAGFLTAPLAAVLTMEVTIHRALAMLPFGVLIAASGVEWLLSQRLRWRLAGACLLAAILLEFGLFYRDYMSDYRVRSSIWFERNIRGALELVIAREPIDRAVAVYLDADIPFVDSNWRLYGLKHRRDDLFERTIYFEAKYLDVKNIPTGSLLVSDASSPIVDGLVSSGNLRTLAVVGEPDQTPSFLVLER